MFSVFDTKRDIIIAAIEQHLDPAPIIDGLADIKSGLTLREQLEKAAAIITSSSEDAVTLLGVLKTLPADGGSASHRHHDFMRNWLGAVTRAANALLERNSTQLTTSPELATAAFTALLMATSRPYGNEHHHLSMNDAVELLLNGIAEKGAADAD